VIIETASREKSAYDIVKTASVVVKPETFTVNFDPNGGSPKPESVTVRHDSAVARPVDPSMSDRQFLGWFTAPQGGLMEFGTVNLLANDKMVKKWDFTNDKVTEDMTLYARWGLRPEPSGGSSVHIPLPSWPYITGPDTINLLTVSDSVYQPYTFGGYPAPTYGISDTEPNTANATLNGNTLTIPEGLSAAGSSYSVTLFATNSAGTVTKTITVNVSPPVETPPTITGPDTILLPPPYTIAHYPYTVTGSPTTYEITNISSSPEFFSFDGVNLSIESGLNYTDSPFTLTLTVTNSAGTATKDITVYVIMMEPSSIGVDEGYTSSEALFVTGARSYTLSLQNAPTWVSLSDNMLIVSPPAGTLTGGLSDDFTADIVITVSGGETYTTPICITVNP
jgi:PKD repeat protein